jgi:hypothetical protein
VPARRTERLERYLADLFGGEVRILSVDPLAETSAAGAAKEYGYGKPLRIRYTVDGTPRSAVLGTASPGPYGHERMADRAAMVLWDYGAYNSLPAHARALDVGMLDSGGNLSSVRKAEEFFLLVEHVEGAGYIRDIARLQDGGELRELDVARSHALCDYLSSIHRVKGDDPGLYVRRIRELVGHGECIMGMADGYPAGSGFITSGLLEEIERRCVSWRWRLKGWTHRLRQVHGDFHPFNILFREGTDFSVLDRSRGEWGEPADDVTALTANYLFASLQAHGRMAEPFETLFRGFWERYIGRTGDEEILLAAAPFFAFRCLVMASPVWYPSLSEGVRKKLFSFTLSVLHAPRFDPARVNEHLSGL